MLKPIAVHAKPGGAEYAPSQERLANHLSIASATARATGARGGARAESTGRHEAGGQGDDRPLVLIVDDDPQIRMLAGVCLKKNQFRIREAASGESAIGAFQDTTPSLVLCDVMMPGMDGFDLCAALRELPGGEHVPIVMMTGLEDMESIERAYALGATEFCIKPLNWSLLPRHLRFILKASQSQEALRASEERYALAAHGANDALWDWNVVDGSAYFSPRWHELLGAASMDGERGIDTWLERIHPEDEHRVRNELEGHLQGQRERFESEHRIRRDCGDYVWTLVRGVAVRDASGAPQRMAGSMTDITARKEAVDRLQHNALHDELTGLPNRTLFMDRLGHCVRRLERHPDDPFAVLFIDLDRFKVVNDSLGHFVGDRLLIEVAERLESMLRRGETLARFGGDEFAVLVESTSESNNATQVAERIQRALRQPAVINGHNIVTMASIGIAISNLGYQTPDEILRDADIAMYAAKKQGPGHSELFETNMHIRAVHSLELERELRHALEHGQIRVHYQPIACLQSGRISGLEALARWDHPIRGTLKPVEFLDIAVDTGLIVPLGRSVIEQACRQLASWQQRWSNLPPWFVSVNLSPQELLQPDLLDVMDDIIARTAMNPERLKVEITERSIIQNLDEACEVMCRLRERGISLSVDDFGTGFSSFSYLDKLPFDVMKIDRSFVSGLHGGSDKQRIVQAMVCVAHDLGMQVIAEGSETTDSLHCLSELGCEYAQGHIVSQALNPEEMNALLDLNEGTCALSIAGQRALGA